MSILVSAGDAIGAKLVKEAGFQGIWVSGFEASARLGLPDNGTITLAQMIYICKPIVKATDLPVYVDVDTGYSNFKQTIKEFENIGVAGLCIEDNIPELKVNSLWGEKIPLLSKEDFAKKIDVPHKIAIIARTESLVRGYPEQVWERLYCYGEAGADYLFPHSRTSPLQVPQPSEFKWVIAPTKFPQFTNHLLKSMGYSMIIWANQTERTKIKAVRDMLVSLKKHDRMLEAEKDLCVTLDDMKGLTPND